MLSTHRFVKTQQNVHKCEWRRGVDRSVAPFLPAQASNGCRALHTAILLMRKVPAEDQPKLLAVALIELCASWLAGFTVYIMILPRCSG